MTDDSLSEKQQQLVLETINRCTDKKTAHEVIRRLERKWGKPEIITVHIQDYLFLRRKNSYNIAPVR